MTSTTMSHSNDVHDEALYQRVHRLRATHVMTLRKSLNAAGLHEKGDGAFNMTAAQGLQLNQVHDKGYDIERVIAAANDITAALAPFIKEHQGVAP